MSAPLELPVRTDRHERDGRTDQPQDARPHPQTPGVAS